MAGRLRRLDRGAARRSPRKPKRRRRATPWIASRTDRRVRLEVLEVRVHILDEVGGSRHGHGRRRLARDGDGVAVAGDGRGDLEQGDARLVRWRM